MNATFAQIDWTTANCFRLATLIIQTVLLMEMVLMLSHYWWRMMPLRRKIKVLAPPIGWAFAYHVVVTVLVATIWISTFQRLAFDNVHSTVGTYLNPVISLALWIVTRQFLRYYSKDLNQAEQDHFRQ